MISQWHQQKPAKLLKADTTTANKCKQEKEKKGKGRPGLKLVLSGMPK
jgi:hypothetical protein